VRPPKEFYVGIVLGLFTNRWWLRKHLRAWSGAIERGDLDEAQRQANRAFLTRRPDLWLKRPPETN
jgi:hypothetical protein